MRGMLDFSLPEEQEEFQLAQKGQDFKDALGEIHQELIRPHRKHGYCGPLGAVHQKNPELIDEFMSVLETQFFKILERHGVEI